ncbi:MAG: hypothetical protein Q9222_002200 [Ikaeria aurantiellina]
MGPLPRDGERKLSGPTTVTGKRSSLANEVLNVRSFVDSVISLSPGAMLQGCDELQNRLLRQALSSDDFAGDAGFNPDRQLQTVANGSPGSNQAPLRDHIVAQDTEISTRPGGAFVPDEAGSENRIGRFTQGPPADLDSLLDIYTLDDAKPCAPVKKDGENQKKVFRQPAEDLFSKAKEEEVETEHS